MAKLGECQVPAADSYFAPLKEQNLPADRCIAEDRMMEKWRESTLPLGQPVPMVLSLLGIFSFKYTQILYFCLRSSVPLMKEILIL